MEKDRAILFFAALFACLANAAWADLTLNNTISNDPMGDIMNRINDVACIFLTLITYMASGISAIIIIYAGVKYMTSQDAEQTTNAKNMIMYAIAGLALVILACPIVDYLVIGTKIVPFQEKCNCFGSIGKDPDVTNPPALSCSDGTPAGGCSAIALGYKCILGSTGLVLVLDSSCSSPPGPTSSTTTTTTTTTSSTTTTTMADHGICYNAERDALCSGLNVLRPGLQADCCNEWGCCCSPVTGTCISP
jgi:hypothetical protein